VNPPVVRLPPGTRLDLDRVGVDRIVTVDGRPGLFTPLVGADPTDAHSSENLEKIVDVLRQQVAQLQSENAALTAKLAELQSPARSSDDLAAGLQRSLDSLQQQLGEMANGVTNFAVREFALESKVHVDVTELGTIGFRFVQPGEDVNAAALSTVSLTVVPVPKPAADPAPPAADPAVDSIDGLSPAQVRSLRAAHVSTVSSFRQIATRARTSASLVSLLGVDRATLGRYTLLAGLLTVPGLDRTKAAVLYDAGLTDVPALAAADPADLVKRYARAAKARRDGDAFRPTAAEAAVWIAAAGRLVAGRGEPS
jgi:hypothetical protein